MDYYYEGDFIKGIFLNRPNRFIGEIDIGYKVIKAHIANTGRMREILVPGKTVYLRRAKNPNRYTEYDLVSINHDGIIVNLDSQIPNKIVEMAFKENLIEGWTSIDSIKREVTVGDSRLDMVVEKNNEKLYVEVKGVDLLIGDKASFPDAVTKRGTKHLKKLKQLAEEGHHAMNIFLIAREDAKTFRPNYLRDKVYSDTFYEVLENKVEARAYTTHNRYNKITFGKRIPIISKVEMEEEINNGEFYLLE